MPLYEYRCTQCKHQFERLLRGVEVKEPQMCPACESIQCERLISQSSFSLKGEGWARDGYSNSSKE